MPKLALADPMDPALERLTLPLGVDADGNNVYCTDGAGGFVGTPPAGFVGDMKCQPDQDAFKKLIAQYAFAIAPLAMHPARTPGFGGFHVTLGAAYTTIDAGKDYWKYGTQGGRSPSDKSGSTKNNSVDSVLQAYTINVTKGLPFGFELSANVGFLARTSIMLGGADLRWSLLEGFRSGVPGIFPDVAVGGGVRTITGTPQFQLTVASADAQISKPIPIADASILQPYVGYQMLKIFGDSGLIDFTPSTDQLGYCGYQGPQVPGTPGATGVSGDNPTGYSGQPQCSGGSSADFNNTRVFDKARQTRHRLIVGLQYRYEMVLFGGQYMTDIVDPSDASSGDDGKALKGMPRQNVFAFQLGVAF